MENEKNFYPAPEEEKPKTFRIAFSGERFGEVEEKTGGSVGLAGKLGDWWERKCRENNIDLQEERFKDVAYYMIEAGKNALEYRDNGEIEIIFGENDITVVVSNSGPGWDGNPSDDILYGSPGHGLAEIKEFSDEFMIETNQRRYVKVSGQDELKEEEAPEFKDGARITFIKKFK